ncbi:MAG: DUF4065 domain-containing protein ['Waltheria sp.' little leaf phytoplasma]|nr:DUF4065 domain-containing protein ['Waltheria sp.' little leaf phytoplasma]
MNNNKPINVFDIAQFFITKEKKINKMKIQALLYYAQGYSLAKYNQVLFEEPIEAWPYGPIISAVYAETLKQEFQKQAYFDFSSRMTHASFTAEQKALLEQVFYDLGRLSANQLQEQIKQEDPWRNAYNAHKLYAACEINPIILRQFFKKNLFCNHFIWYFFYLL